MEAIRINNAIIHLAESKAVCPHCERKIPFDEIEDKFKNLSNCYIRIKCKCKRLIGITTNIIGDYVAYKLNVKSNNYIS